MSPVHIDELNPETRTRVLKQIEETEGVTTALAVVEPKTQPLYSSARGLEAPVPEFRYMRPAALHAHPINQRIYGNEIPNRDFLKSIEDVGILEPLIVVEFAFTGEEPKFYIVSGHRRWLAAKQLGLRRVLVRDGGRLYRGETQEERELSLERNLLEANRQREKTPEQRAREFQELLRINTELAAQRKLRVLKRGSVAPVKVILPEREESGQARDLAAKATGDWSGQTALKMAAIVQAADNGSKEAKAVVAAINAKTDSISSGYSRVQHLLLPLEKRRQVESRAEHQEEHQEANQAARLKKILSEIEEPTPPNKTHLKILATVRELVQKADAALSEVSNVESIEEYEALVQIHQASRKLSETTATITKETKNLHRHLAQIDSRQITDSECNVSGYWDDGELPSVGFDDRECLRQFKKFAAQKGWLCTGGYHFVRVDTKAKKGSSVAKQEKESTALRTSLANIG